MKLIKCILGGSSDWSICREWGFGDTRDVARLKATASCTIMLEEARLLGLLLGYFSRQPHARPAMRWRAWMNENRTREPIVEQQVKQCGVWHYRDQEKSIRSRYRGELSVRTLLACAREVLTLTQPVSRILRRLSVPRRLSRSHALLPHKNRPGSLRYLFQSRSRGGRERERWQG